MTAIRRPASVIEDVQLVLKNGKQPLDIAVLPGQNVDDHGSDPRRRLEESVDEKTVPDFALDQGAAEFA